MLLRRALAVLSIQALLVFQHRLVSFYSFQAPSINYNLLKMDVLWNDETTANNSGASVKSNKRVLNHLGKIKVSGQKKANEKSVVGEICEIHTQILDSDAAPPSGGYPLIARAQQAGVNFQTQRLIKGHETTAG